MMNPISKFTKDPDMLGILPAARRARRNAILLARQTQTGFIVMRHGKVVDLNHRRNRPGVRRKPYTTEEKALIAQKRPSSSSGV